MWLRRITYYLTASDRCLNCTTLAPFLAIFGTPFSAIFATTGGRGGLTSRFTDQATDASANLIHPVMKVLTHESPYTWTGTLSQPKRHFFWQQQHRKTLNHFRSYVLSSRCSFMFSRLPEEITCCRNKGNPPTRLPEIRYFIRNVYASAVNISSYSLSIKAIILTICPKYQETAVRIAVDDDRTCTLLRRKHFNRFFPFLCSLRWVNNMVRVSLKGDTLRRTFSVLLQLQLSPGPNRDVQEKLHYPPFLECPSCQYSFYCNQQRVQGVKIPWKRIANVTKHVPKERGDSRQAFIQHQRSQSSSTFYFPWVASG